MKKILLAIPLLVLVGCGGGHVYSDEYDIVAKECSDRGGIKYVGGSIYKDATINYTCTNGFEGSFVSHRQ